MIEFSFGTIGILLLAAGLPSETSRPGVWRSPLTPDSRSRNTCGGRPTSSCPVCWTGRAAMT